MSADWFVIGLLTILLLASNVYWAQIARELNSRLMSRNHFEFVQTEKLRKENPKRGEVEEGEMRIDPQDERQAQELNTLMGMA